MVQKVTNEEHFILQKMIEGDENAFKYFFDTYYDDLCNFINCYIRDEALSEDIAQSIFIYLWEKKDSLPPHCSMKSYLYAASKNKSLNYLRNMKNRERIAGEFISISETSLETADRFLEFEELKKIIGDAIEKLPAQCKTIYQLSRDGELSNREIAEKLGIGVKTVENQITIAIKKLKDFIQPYHDQIFFFFLVINFF